jgi:hypothetical protein
MSTSILVAQSEGLTAGFPVCLAYVRHSHCCCRHRSALHVSTFLRSFRSTPITELHRYYGRSDSCSSGSSGHWSMNSGSFHKQVSLIHARSLSDHSVSNHLAPTVGALSCYPSARQLPVLRFRLRHRYAGSSGIPGRIEFLIVRTGRSPPVALHLASRRRSYSRLQVGEHMPEEDLHLSDNARSRAHIGVGRHDWVRSPSLRTGQAVLPHPALQLVVHPVRD